MFKKFQKINTHLLRYLIEKRRTRNQWNKILRSSNEELQWLRFNTLEIVVEPEWDYSFKNKEKKHKIFVDFISLRNKQRGSSTKELQLAKL